MQGISSFFGIIVDAKGALGWLQPVLVAMTAQPIFDLLVPLAFLLALAVVTFWPRDRNQKTQDTNTVAPDFAVKNIAQDVGGAHEPPTQAQHDLKVFVTDHIIWTGCAQLHLQKSIVNEICNNSVLAEIASHSLLANHYVAQFGRPFQKVWDAYGSSPVEELPLQEMMTAVLEMDKSYQTFCDQTEKLATGSCLQAYRTHDTLGQLWEDWRRKHNELVKAYRAIKRDPRFPMLVRPGIEGPWDREVPPIA